jgi:hypothetical protein
VKKPKRKPRTWDGFLLISPVARGQGRFSWHSAWPHDFRKGERYPEDEVVPVRITEILPKRPALARLKEAKP